MTKGVRLQFSVPKENVDRLEQLSKYRGISKSSLISLLIYDAYIADKDNMMQVHSHARDCPSEENGKNDYNKHKERGV